MPVERPDSLAGNLLQGKGNCFCRVKRRVLFCGSQPAGDEEYEAMPVERPDSLAGQLLQGRRICSCRAKRRVLFLWEPACWRFFA